MAEERATTKHVIKIDQELLENIEYLIEINADNSLFNILVDIHPADIAELLNHLPSDKSIYLFHLLDSETASELILDLDETLREKVLKSSETERITDIVDEMEIDDAADIIADLPDEIAEQVLDNIDSEDSEEVKELLKYAEDTAGGIMSTNFIYVLDDQTVDDAINVVRKHSEDFDHIYHVYVLNSNDKLIGIVFLKTLIIYSRFKKISEVLEKDLIYVHPEVDQEEVARTMTKYNLVAIPVVDSEMKMLGRITFDDVVDVIQEEAVEDLSRIAGLNEEEETSDTIFDSTKNRLPWLLVSLFGELISAFVLLSYQASIEKMIVASFFIPIVMALGGSSGTQAAIITVRSITLGDLWPSHTTKKLIKEFQIANINGFLLGSVLLISTFFLFKTEFSFSLLIAFTLLIILNFATIVGSAIPMVLHKMKVDPAIATGPFVTTMNDIFGLLIYLGMVTFFFL